MQRQTIQVNHLQTMSWFKDTLVIWTNGGKFHFKGGELTEINKYSFENNFDSSVISESGEYEVLYQKLGTKGLLLKNGKILREIYRSDYHAETYEYPIAFATGQNGKTYLIHCPSEYCRIDIEEVETGEIVTNKFERNPSDFFHSRFEVSPDNKTFISKGWVWHPYDTMELFGVDACIQNPLLLDKGEISKDIKTEICAASYINNELILMGSPNLDTEFNRKTSDKFGSGQIAIWNIRTNLVSSIVDANFTISGHLIPIDEKYAWDLFDYPKIVNYQTGLVEEKLEDVFTGKQQSSIIRHLVNLPIIAINHQSKRIAISNKDKIEILTK